MQIICACAQYAFLREVQVAREYKVLIFWPWIQSSNILLLSSQTGRAGAVWVERSRRQPSLYAARYSDKVDKLSTLFCGSDTNYILNISKSVYHQNDFEAVISRLKCCTMLLYSDIAQFQNIHRMRFDLLQHSHMTRRTKQAKGRSATRQQKYSFTAVNIKSRPWLFVNISKNPSIISLWCLICFSVTSHYLQQVINLH